MNLVVIHAYAFNDSGNFGSVNAWELFSIFEMINTQQLIIFFLHIHSTLTVYTFQINKFNSFSLFHNSKYILTIVRLIHVWSVVGNNITLCARTFGLEFFETFNYSCTTIPNQVCQLIWE